jgi:hypothetical protein
MTLRRDRCKGVIDTKFIIDPIKAKEVPMEIEKCRDEPCMAV